MKCTACQSDVADNAKFCTNCGSSMASVLACRHCGVANNPNATFCVDCGKSLKAPDPIPSKTGNTPSSNDFIFAFTEQVAKAKAAASESTPWGYFAVVMQDGFVSQEACQQIQREIEAEGPKPSLWERIWGFIKAKSWTPAPGQGQTGKKSDVYFVMDAKGLPLITHVRPTPVTGYPDAKLKFEFWIDVPSKPAGANDNSWNALALFFQRCVGQRSSLTIHEFKKLAIDEVEKLMPSINVDSLISDPASAQLISKDLQRLSGISSRCFFVLGKVEERIQMDISRGPQKCGGCGTKFMTTLRFCTECGDPMDTPESKSSIQHLISKDGQEITLRLSMTLSSAPSASGGQVQIQRDEAFDQNVAFEVVQHLAPELRRYATASLMEPGMLDGLTDHLSNHLMRQFRGFITGFTVLDIRTSAEDWFFKTDAQIKEELRKLEAQKQYLQIDEAEIDLAEAAFAVALRDKKRRQSEELRNRQAEIQARAQDADLDIQEVELETRTDLRREAIADSADKERMEREAQRLERERSLRRNETREDRSDEIEGLDHDQGLEKKMVKHDLDVAEMVGDAESRSRRRDISDLSFEEEEKIRLRAKEIQEVGSLEEDREDRKQNRKLSELEKLASIDANLEAQKNEFELAKIQSMKGLSAQELLAMQAAQLAKAAGGGEATANLIKALADSQAATAAAEAQADSNVADVKEKMYQQMLEVQQKSADATVQAYKESAQMMHSSSQKNAETAIQAHKEAAQIAQSTNEKSMDAMSKVAEKAAGSVSTAVAVKLGGEATEKEPKMKTCTNADCGHTWPADKPVKFCEKCGTASPK